MYTMLIGLKSQMIVAATNVLTWEEGKMFIFDDSFEHEVSHNVVFAFRFQKWRHEYYTWVIQVWNETSGTRIVLIIDIIHPEMNKQQVSYNKSFLHLVS